MSMILLAIVRILLEEFKEGADKGTQQAIDLASKPFTKAMSEFDPYSSVFNAFK